MLQRATRRAAVGAALLVALSGCTASHPPPPALTDKDVDAYNQRVLDDTWKESGLDGAVPRPTVYQGDALEDPGWTAALSSCLNDAKLDMAAITSYTGGGWTIATTLSPGSAEDVRARLVLYLCVAQHPQKPSLGTMLSSAQMDYLYDYYLGWVAPCLLDQRQTLTYVPSKQDFHDMGGQWTPYQALPSLGVGEEARLIELCGPEYPGMGAVGSSTGDSP